VLHIMAIVQIRHDTEGRAYYRRKLAAGKTPMEALRCLKRRLSDVLYRQLVADIHIPQAAAITDADGPEASPEGQLGTTTGLQRGRLTPHHRHFEEVTSRARPHDATPTNPTTQGPLLDIEGSHERMSEGVVAAFASKMSRSGSARS